MLCSVSQKILQKSHLGIKTFVKFLFGHNILLSINNTNVSGIEQSFHPAHASDPDSNFAA